MDIFHYNFIMDIHHPFLAIFFIGQGLKEYFSLAHSSILFIIYFILLHTIQLIKTKKIRNSNTILKTNDIWSEPNQQAERLFVLHEGTKMQLLDSLEEWQKIRIANGSEGWIKELHSRRLINSLNNLIFFYNF